MPEERYYDRPFAVIGEEDLVAGLRALGFRVYPAQDNAEARPSLARALEEKAAILLVQDNIYHFLRDEIEAYRNLPLPVFIPFAKDGGASLLQSLVKEMRLRATGTF